MVSFKPQGRMGNFLFAFAASYAYSLKHGLGHSVPTATNDPKWNPIYFMDRASPYFGPEAVEVVIQEKTYFKYDEPEFNESWRHKGIIFEGYFQNYNYFEKYRKEILDFFNFDYTILNGLVSVHVRRGDYITLRDKHPEVTTKWYEDAMNEFKGYKFVFFSDDIEWCRNEFGHRSDCHFASGGTELDDLKFMLKCEHFINSASTFSWWGAWLNKNPNKRVIVPKQWLMPAHSNQWTEEIVPKTWERR